MLFITGLCNKHCFYCPLSESRKNVDKVFADEVEVSSDLEVILEAKAISAQGAGLTGGDPLLTPKKTLHYIKLLKEFFGKNFHIHLYTAGGNASKELLLQLKRQGLDEIRFHPETRWWKAIQKAISVGLETGAEMPVIPLKEHVALLKKFIIFLSKSRASFINLNELEICPPNYFSLRQRGFKLAEGSLSAVEGSEEAAYELLNWALQQGLDLNIHYCPSIVKDKAQVRKRLANRAKNVAKGYQRTIKTQALLEHNVIKLSKEINVTKRKICSSLNIKPNVIKLLKEENQTVIYLHPSIRVRELRNALGCTFSMPIKAKKVRVLPTYTRTEVSSNPLRCF